jgi:hypothetical protein
MGIVDNVFVATVCFVLALFVTLILLELFWAWLRRRLDRRD